jgi:uncharacterized protein YndB with AHSA1/START domain
MASAQRSITIARPPADVFAYVANGENGPKWRSANIEIKRESGEGVGAIYRQTVPGPMGRRVKADYEVTAYEPPNRLAFKAIAGPVRPTGEFKLAKAGDGTKITFSLEAQMSLVKRLLMGRAVRKSMDVEMKSLDKLKAVLEKSGGASKSAAAPGATKPAASKTPTARPRTSRPAKK